MAQYAEKLEEKYISHRANPKDRLNYQWHFPAIVETFLSPEQKRKVLVVRFIDSNASQMVSIAKMVRKDNLRVDIKTSVWILGKLLKALLFFHDQRISVGEVSIGKILIDPEQHFVNFFDLSLATFSQEPLDEETCRAGIVQATQVVMEVLGVDLDSGEYPYPADEEEVRYLEHLRLMEEGIFGDVQLAHQRFYELVESLWGRKFHEFTTLTR